MINKFIRNSIFKLSSIYYCNDDSKVIFYHDIHHKKTYYEHSTPFDLFKQHIETIRKNNLKIVNEITEKSNQVKLQFDDGYKGIHDCIEMIIELNVPIEVFVSTAFIGQKSYLTITQMNELLKTGLVHFSSHTHNHVNLSECDDKKIDYELKKSKEVLEHICNSNINSICYPFGSFSKKVMELCESNGYQKQYSSLPGSFHNRFMSKVIRRNLVQHATNSELKSVLKGAHQIMNRRYLNNHFSE
ncbi:MAG: polysaccharide deacetylase family protein [Flavobacteriales bacterium]